jgi:hypothetical protein
MPRSRGRVRGFPVETFLRRLRPTPIPYTSWLTGTLHRNRERPDPPSKARRAGTRPPRLRPRGTRHPPAPEVSLGLCERRRAGFARLSGWQSVGNWVASGANFPVSLLPVGVTPTTSRRIATRSFAPKNGQKPKPSGRLAYMSSAHRTGHKPSPRRGIFFFGALAQRRRWKRGGNRHRRRQECRDRISLGGRPLRSAFRIGRKPRGPSCRAFGGARRRSSGIGGQVGNGDDTDRVHAQQRPGQARIALVQIEQTSTGVIVAPVRGRIAN